MITKLNKSEFYKIRHITDKCKNIEVRAVVSGNNPGGVYVDHSTEPTAVLIWIEGQKGFQIVGDPQSISFLTGLEEYMRKHIEPKLQKQNINCVEIGVDPDPWDRAIQNIFKTRGISSDTQHVFTLRGNPQPIEFQNQEVNIQRIDRDLLESRRWENHSFLEKKILRFWDSTDSFLEQGFGYFVEDNNNVVSLCFSAFIVDNTHAIDIETLEGIKE